MRTETVTRVIKSFDELTDDEKDKVIEVNFENAWHFEHSLQERIETLEAFASRLGGKLDYSISCVPDRGEYIEIENTIYDEGARDIFQDRVREFIEDEKDCPLTGVCYDEDLRDSLKKYYPDFQCISYALKDYLNAIHKEYEYTLSHEYIGELCEANEYEFYTDTWKMA